MIKVESKAGKLIITADIDKNPPASASGKTLVVASTHGFTSTDIMIDGKAVSVSLNACIRS